MSNLAQSLEVILEAARRAQAASPNAQPDDPALERKVRLRDVLNRVPSAARWTPRSDLEARMAPELLKVVSRWHWGSGNVVLSAGTGAGKTSAAVHLVRRLCSEAAQDGGEAYDLAQFIRWQECRELSAAVRETKLGAGAADDIIRCQNARLLVLDDLGAGDDRATLERVLEARYERAWPTITTTGMRQDELLATFGDALSRRLMECGAKKGQMLNLWRTR